MDENQYVADFVAAHFKKNPLAILPISTLNEHVAAEKRMFDIANISRPANVFKQYLLENGWGENTRQGIKGVDVNYQKFLGG
jgi:hypothetical protein